MKRNAEVDPAFEPGQAPEGGASAVKVWNMLGGLDWDGLEYAAEIVGVDDVELLVRQLCVIREFTAPRKA